MILVVKSSMVKRATTLETNGKEIKNIMVKKLAYDIVKKHVDEWDPIGLLELGVPDDEYDIEVMMIAEKLSVVFDIQQLADVIQTVVNDMFYDGEGTFPLEDCEEVATLIWGDIINLQRRAKIGRLKKGARKKSKA